MLYEQANLAINQMEQESGIDRDNYTYEIEFIRTKMSEVSNEMNNQERDFSTDFAAIEDTRDPKIFVQLLFLM